MNIAPDIAEALLLTDFENVCAKLKAGGTLTSPERKLLSDAAKLAPKYGAAPLTPAEIPAPPLIAAPDPDPCPQDGPLTAEQVAKYSALYGTERRALFRWLAVGKAHNYPCPLHSPVKLLAWWSKPRMKQRVPQKILDAAQAAALTSPAAPPFATESPPLNGHVSVDPAPPSTLDFPAQVEYMRRALAGIQERHALAERGRVIDGAFYVDEPAVESLLRQWLAIGEPLRKSESTLTNWLEQRGKLCSFDEAKSEIRRIMHTVQNALARVLKVVRPQLKNKSDAEQDRLWETEFLACFLVLQSSKFTKSDAQPS